MNLPKEGSAALVSALCADYRRRAEEIRRGALSRRTVMEYRYLNAKIRDAAESIVGERLAPIFIDEIGSGTGFAKSRVECMSEETYKIYKSEARHAIARALHLED